MTLLSVPLATAALVAFQLCVVCRADIFRSTHEIGSLVKKESDIINALDNFLKIEDFGGRELVKEKLKIFTERMRLANERASSDATWAYNPINGVQLLTRFAYEWKRIIKNITKTNPQSHAAKQFTKSLKKVKSSRKLPTEDDVIGGMSGLVRLIVVYDLDIGEVANGVIRHVTTDKIATADLIHLGQALFKAGRYFEAALILNGTLSVAKFRASANGGDEPGVDMWNLYSLLHFAFFRYDSTALAIDVVREAKLKFPQKREQLNRALDKYAKSLANGVDAELTFLRPMEMKLYGGECHTLNPVCYYTMYKLFLEEELKYNPRDRKLRELYSEMATVVDAHQHDSEIAWGFRKPKHVEMYMDLCRGELKDERRLSQLYCEFQKTAVPLYRGKKEYVNIDPDIVVFHDLIGDRDAEWLRNKVVRDMRSSDIECNMPEGCVDDDVRVSKTAWIYDDANSAVTERLTTKIELLTGLASNTAYGDDMASEPYQVVNYGLGGMYSIHLDVLVTS